MVEEYKEEAKEGIELARTKFERLVKKGVRGESIDAFLSKAESAMENGDCLKAVDYAVQTIEEIERIEKLYAKAFRAIAQAQTIDEDAVKAGVRVPKIRKILDEAKSWLKKEDFIKAYQYASKFRKEMEKLGFGSSAPPPKVIVKTLEKELNMSIEDEIAKTEELVEIEAEEYVDDITELRKKKYKEMLKKIFSVEKNIEDAKKFQPDYIEMEKLEALIDEAYNSLKERKYSEVEEWLEAVNAQLDLMKLPFTHGIEMEIQVVRSDGRWLDGSKLQHVFSRLVTDGKEMLEKILKDENTPLLIREKVSDIRIENIVKPGHSRGLVVVLKYLVHGTAIDIEIIGRDAHGSGITWILEIVTPPCEYVLELEWWAYVLFKICYDIIKSTEGVIIISSGINPIEQFTEGFSYGDHHHIGIPDMRTRKFAYNLIKNYLPHLIGMTANSPIIGMNVPKVTYTPRGNIITDLLSDPFSIRLKVNQRQLGPNDERRYIPYLDEDDDINSFRETIGYATDYDARFVDMFPYTRFDTIEVRVFDAQLTIRDRIGIAIFLQALALKAMKFCKENIKIPNISSSTLIRLRERAILKGLSMNLHLEKNGDKKDFLEIYQEKLCGTKEKVRTLRDACDNMLYYIKDEIASIGATKGNYLDTFLIGLYGGKNNLLAPPITPAQFQLYLLTKKANNDLKKFVEEFGKVADRLAKDRSYNPLTELFGAPNTPDFLKPKKGVR
ncbi:MAG: hypothetical protein AB1779_04445 [Candidatus Thermoplasmatota archaeon]